MTVEHIRVFRVPRKVIADTTEALQNAGSEGYELFVLWSGTRERSTFTVRTTHVPEQTSYRTENGLLVKVTGDALHKLNVWLYQNGESLAAQVHAHPTDAFHSDTDDTFPIVTALGGLSIVAADFARHGLLTRESAAYRLTADGWVHIPLGELAKLIEVFD